MPETFLPPDETQLALAARVNKALPAGAAVNFFRVSCEDGHDESGIVYQYGPLRTTKRIPGDLIEHDAPEIIAAVEAWIRQVRYRNRWTEDPSEAS